MHTHLDELRIRITRSLVAIGVAFIACYYFSTELYNFISRPILRQLPDTISLIATQVTAPFMVPLQLSFICALLSSAPYVLYQIWMFICPGLYKHERQNITPIIVASCILFYLGIAFALLIICPLALKFFTSYAPDGVKVMLDIGSYLDFIVTIAVATGIAFQIPVITNILIRSGIVSRQQLQQKRRHIIVLAFVLGMLLAPPDVISQILLAIPMWLLFELGLLFSKPKRSTKKLIHLSIAPTHKQ